MIKYNNSTNKSNIQSYNSDITNKCKYSKIAIFGLPASGKGTLAEKIAKQFNLKHISSGDILRREFKENKINNNNSNTTNKINITNSNTNNNSNTTNDQESSINKGGFATDEYIINLLSNYVPDDNYILDGFPRTIAQIDVFDIDMGILIDVSEEVALKRMEIRRNTNISDNTNISSNTNNSVCNNTNISNNICNISNNTNISNIRNDDNYDTFINRLHMYKHNTQPVVDELNSRNKLIIVDGNKNKEEVLEKVLNYIM
ncbi:adk [Ecytonucleospora hepatopenaei]|uniref:Adk n=1 Tax=Ecytonucleospora hepatopenaei TaxID=646526 RepID=A0A1W0E4I4_9MICR|nr:adk [Ecytonucleospora hepatopenaei]